MRSPESLRRQGLATLVSLLYPLALIAILADHPGATLPNTLAGAVRDRRYIAGEHFSAADVYVGSQIGWGMQFGTIDERPEFVAYWNGLKDRPARLAADRYMQDAMQKAGMT